nr:hypothetical protein [Tanacetum cinerariifolium]
MEQYITNTDYALWEVIVNGDAPAAIASEDANLKLLRSLPPAWNTHNLIMRNKYDLDTLSMGDLYNNLKVHEAEIKGQSILSSNSQNVAFVFSDNTSSTNEIINTAHNVSAASLQGQASTSTYADDVMFSFFSNQSNNPQLDNEDLEQINTDDLNGRGIEIETIQEGLYQWRLMLMPWLLLMGCVMIGAIKLKKDPQTLL